MELSVSTFYECLSTCMKQFVSKCRSIEYSHSKQVCRFSGHTVMGPASKQDTDDVLIDDDTFDYYQFMWSKSPCGPLHRGLPSAFCIPK